MSGFSSLGLGARALSAAQRALDVTGQNISNANTAGYSRQRIEQVAAGGSVVPAMWSRSTSPADGVVITGITRIRDEFAEARALSAQGDLSHLSTVKQTYGDIETTFGEPSDTGLQEQLSAFWGSWHDIAINPTEDAPRSQMLEQASTLASTFNGLSSRMNQQWLDSREQLVATVSDVNSMAADVARLNAAIRSAVTAGNPANELSDQRDVLVMKLGQAVGATATAGADGVVNVNLGGSPLVTGDRTRALQVAGPTNHTPGATNELALQWAADGSAAVGGGSVQGLLDAVNTTLPSYLTALDGIARSVMSAVNQQQAKGYDRTAAAAPPSSPPNGQAIFAGTGAGDMAVAISNPQLVAASAAQPPAYDGDNASAMGLLANLPMSPATGSTMPPGPDATYRNLMVQLGVQAQSANRQTDLQTSVAGQLEDARTAASGVSLDEEMTNLVNFQHSYEAAAKFITTIDSTLDTLINMTR
ncbi:MAG: flagellar hook-associated protein FlgK [Oryzihumus sp.]